MKISTFLVLSLAIFSPFAASAMNAVREAETAMAAGHYEYAYVQWKRVLTRKPGNPEAMTALARLERIAQGLFEEALQTSDSVQAKDLLRTVVLISDPWSEINREARLVLGADL